MSNFELKRFSSPDELAEAAARDWLSVVETEAKQSTPFCVALSGGRIARQFSAAAARLAEKRRELLNGIHFFWGDERCVPPTDRESNFAIARDLLIRPLNIPESQIHRVRGELEPELAAAQAAEELCRVTSSRAEDQPILDLVFLGMGEDGHVASLFPGESEAISASRAIFRPVTASKPPPRRITLGFPALAAARQVWVLASGAGKEQAIRNSLSAEGKTPLARVLKLRSATRIYSDVIW